MHQCWNLHTLSLVSTFTFFSLNSNYNYNLHQYGSFCCKYEYFYILSTSIYTFHQKPIKPNRIIITVFTPKTSTLTPFYPLLLQNVNLTLWNMLLQLRLIHTMENMIFILIHNEVLIAQGRIKICKYIEKTNRNYS